MNLLSLAEKLGAEEQTPLAFEAKRCLHSGDKLATCAACVAACPTGAIESSSAVSPQATASSQPGTTITFTESACARCYACLPQCPTGAFAAEDELPNVLRCLARLQAETLELVCQQHPAPGVGRADAAAIQVRGCLAGLGVAGLLQMVAAAAGEGPLQRVVVRIDGCAQCPWQTLPALVTAQVAQAKQWLEDENGQLLSAAEGQASFVKRPLHQADAPPVSRRDLFRGRVQAPVAEVTSSLNPFHQRLRLLDAVRRIVDSGDMAVSGPRSAVGFATLDVSAGCNACGTCARACPSGALVMDKDTERFALTFSLQACLACDVCAHLCPEQAIVVDHEVTAEQVLFAPGDTLLAAGELAQCKRCTGRFAVNTMEDGLCAVCAFRTRNPFGWRTVGGRGTLEKTNDH